SKGERSGRKRRKRMDLHTFYLPNYHEFQFRRSTIVFRDPGLPRAGGALHTSPKISVFRMQRDELSVRPRQFSGEWRKSGLAGNRRSRFAFDGAKQLIYFELLLFGAPI